MENHMDRHLWATAAVPENSKVNQETLEANQELDTGEMEIVSENPELNDSAHPLVRILVPVDDQGNTRGESVNLSDREPFGGTDKRRVMNTYNPALYGVQPSAYIL